MDRKVISKDCLASLFVQNEIEAAKLLRDALMDVKEKNKEITDTAIKTYNADTDNAFVFSISLTTIKNYACRYGYCIFNTSGHGCVVKQITVGDYQKIRNELDKNKESESPNTTSKISIVEKLALDYVKKENEYKDQKQISIRFATSVHKKLEMFFDKFPIFNKQYLLSHLINKALDDLLE